VNRIERALPPTKSPLKTLVAKRKDPFCRQFDMTPSAHRAPDAAPAKTPTKPHPTPDAREDEGPRRKSERLDDALDPMTRHLADLTMPLTSSARPVDTSTITSHGPRTAMVSLEGLLPELVRRIAWAGDRRRGSAQLELGAGAYAGTTITVHANDGRVRVEVHGSDDCAANQLRARIAERLAGRGLDVESVT
jgi:hypothetical protein